MSREDLDTKSVFDELNLNKLDRGELFDLGHPLLNRVAHSFLKAAGIGAIQSVSRQAYFTAVEGAGVDLGAIPNLSGKKHPLPEPRGDDYSKSVEALVKNTGRETFQWGLAAGVYSGLTYGMKEARGYHDWKNSAVAGAITGAALALTADEASHDQIARCAITGAALSAAANLLSGIF